VKFELQIKSAITESNEKLAYALRAKKLLIEKNNSKLGDADYLFWHVNTFLPIIKSISAKIAEAREEATVGVPPIIVGMNFFPLKEDEDRYDLERTTLEADKKYDVDIKNENPEFK
jgi:hypothetical protein